MEHEKCHPNSLLLRRALVFGEDNLSSICILTEVIACLALGTHADPALSVLSSLVVVRYQSTVSDLSDVFKCQFRTAH